MFFDQGLTSHNITKLCYFQCCLGLEFFNPNIAGEMAQLMISNQEKYVPSVKSANTTEVIKSVPFHGDQLFEERSRNVQWTFRIGDNMFDRLEGMSPEFADWHAKVTLYKVSTTAD